ncbi:6-phosphofructokinase [Petroclostridium sp. X23]|jgi:6-phosphofructokinase 1|uniref:6-phosphofructokinase n=1 Tax=Petroclostridium sp. X23 TaxID=3045146 RepID=UPI0024AE345D|nr:6-phosphofructokinase [Petroclostridium sp. X23]WHH57053.1 6-phosphofructokinase [Petroclostridium sp. X23]
MYQLSGNCLIGQSGGPTSAINSSLCGIVEQAMRSSLIKNVYGAINGIEGVAKRQIFDFGSQISTRDDYKLLKYTPSAYLGSCRCKLPPSETNPQYYKEIFDIFAEYDIRYFFYIGGNDSMDTVLKLSEYAKKTSYPMNIIGVPKTIDNDLIGTDHTPGFGSAAKFVATTVLEVSRDSTIYDVDSVTIIEIMGRNAGWLTASSALARCNYNTSPDLIYLPEVPFSIDQFIQDIKLAQKEKKSVVIAVSEGIKNIFGQYICESAGHANTDAFGHKPLGGTAKVLENAVRNRLHCKVRSIELNVLQRCAMHMASKTDLDEAYHIGCEAVKAAENGLTAKMMVFHRLSAEQYKVSIGCVDITEIANVEKHVPRKWINEQGNDITLELIDYLKPLIIGEPELTMEDGLPVYLSLDTTPFYPSKKNKAV